jgi:hypothetical protein
MARYRFTVYENENQPHYVVVLGSQRQVIEVQRLEPTTILSGAMAAASRTVTS